jgi:V/A-type H+-transporting ATPase subunit E
MIASARPERSESGVDVLVARLRDEGVAAGRAEAAALVERARAQTREMVEKAAAEARGLLDTARKEADAYRAAGEQALQAAMRDTVLGMKAQLMARFTSDVERLVSEELTDPDLLRRMILEVAGRAGAGIDPDAKVEVILPEAAVALDKLRGDPGELEQSPLTRFALGLSGEMLRTGITLRASADQAAGIEVRVADGKLVVDLSDDAVAGLLLRHLQPRFRAILEGIVRTGGRS